jgi:hypothetical protein
MAAVPVWPQGAVDYQQTISSMDHSYSQLDKKIPWIPQNPDFNYHVYRFLPDVFA